MAALRRGIIGLRYAANFMRSRGFTCPRFPLAIRKNCVTLTITGGLCAIPFIQKPADSLSHEALLRRASSLVTDSANMFLSQSTLALVDCLTQYVKTVRSLLLLQKHYVSTAPRLSPAEEEAVWQIILRRRQELKDLREDCKKFESNWSTATDLSRLAAEVAFNAGADQACEAAQSSLQVAQSHVEQVRQLSLEAEKNLKESNAEQCERIEQPAHSSEDEDVPEAYLRED